jgi:integrase/recombinase XerD
LWESRDGQLSVDEIGTERVWSFLAWLRAEYKPKRFSGNEEPLSPKSIRNAWVTLCAFFRWAGTDFGMNNPMTSVPAPHFEKPPIEPFSKQPLETLLKACEFSKQADTARRKRFAMRRHTARA